MPARRLFPDYTLISWLLRWREDTIDCIASHDISDVARCCPISTGCHICSADRTILAFPSRTIVRAIWNVGCVGAQWDPAVEVPGTFVNRLNSPVKSFSGHTFCFSSAPIDFRHCLMAFRLKSNVSLLQHFYYDLSLKFHCFLFRNSTRLGHSGAIITQLLDRLPSVFFVIPLHR